MSKRLLLTGALIAAWPAAAIAQPGTFCVIAAPPEPWTAGVVLNVRASPNGPILGSLWNGTPVVLVGPEWERWAVIDNGYGLVGWAFAPYLACALPPPPPVIEPASPAYEPSPDEQAERLKREGREFCRRYPDRNECRLQ